MIYPSTFVKKIVEVTEKIISVDFDNGYLGKKYFFDFIVIKASNCFVSLHGDLLKEMDNHSYDLMKKVVECYASIRNGNMFLPSRKIHCSGTMTIRVRQFWNFDFRQVNLVYLRGRFTKICRKCFYLLF